MDTGVSWGLQYMGLQRVEQNRACTHYICVYTYLLLDWYLYYFVMPLSITVFVLKLILSDKSIVTPHSFQLHLIPFSHSLTFSMYVSLDLKYLLGTVHVCVCTKSLQLCLMLCTCINCSPPGSSAHGIFQARILEWIPMPSYRGSSWPKDWTRLSYVFCIGSGSLPPAPPGKPS